MPHAENVPRQAIPSVPRNARHPGGNAPHRSTRRPEKFPATQRAGARRRSPQRGSAAAGAHIAREAGRCAPIAPCGERRTRYTTCDSDALRHTEKGEYGGRRGCRGARPSHPLPLAGRRPRPNAGQQPQASGGNKKEKMPPRRRPRPNAGQQPQASDEKKKKQLMTTPQYRPTPDTQREKHACPPSLRCITER